MRNLSTDRIYLAWPPLQELHFVGRDGAYCGISRGELDWSEFDPELLARACAARDAALESGSDAILHPSDRCGVGGPCADCLEFLAETGEPDVRPGTPAPGVAQFARHAALFGAELVLETARDYLAGEELAVLELEITQTGRNSRRTAATRQRRTTGRLREQVAALHARGLVAIAIADALNISDRRCREILKSLPTTRDDPRNPSVHAENLAAKRSGHAPGGGRRRRAILERGATA